MLPIDPVMKDIRVTIKEISQSPSPSLRIATTADIREWYARGRPAMLSVVTASTSENLSTDEAAPPATTDLALTIQSKEHDTNVKNVPDPEPIREPRETEVILDNRPGNRSEDNMPSQSSWNFQLPVSS
jgi:hypothetical protein